MSQPYGQPYGCAWTAYGCIMLLLMLLKCVGAKKPHKQSLWISPPVYFLLFPWDF